MEKSLLPFHKRWPCLVKLFGLASLRRLVCRSLSASELDRLELVALEILLDRAEPEDIIKDFADSSIITF